MSKLRKLKRQLQKNNGELEHKKVIASTMGISLAEYNARMKRRETNLKEMEGNSNE